MLAALVVAWLFSMTLTPGQATNQVNLVPFSEKRPALDCLVARCPWWRLAFRFLLIDVVGNAAVFVPFGVALAAATLLSPSRPGKKRRSAWGWWARIALAGMVLSASIELAQLFVPGRATDVDDVILNTAGTVAGAALVKVWSIMT